jgi:hypothetical protein
MVSLQRRAPVRRASRLHQTPVLKQFVPVQIEPFQNVSQGSFGEIPVNDAALYLNDDLVFPVRCVEMRRRMFPRENTAWFKRG